MPSPAQQLSLLAPRDKYEAQLEEVLRERPEVWEVFRRFALEAYRSGRKIGGEGGCGADALGDVDA